jgi:hypothetical protein
MFFMTLWTPVRIEHNDVNVVYFQKSRWPQQRSMISNEMKLLAKRKQEFHIF